MEKHNEERPFDILGGSNKRATQTVRRRTNFPPGYDEKDEVIFD